MRKEIQARQIALTQGQETIVTEYKTNPSQSWSAVFFTNGLNGEDVTITQEQLGGGYGTKGEIKFSIGGQENGDIITGTGSCRIKAIANGQDQVLSYYFVDEVYSVQLPPFSQNVVINSAPVYENIGYPPFSRYKCQILTSANYTLQLVDNSGNVVINRLLTNIQFLTGSTYFYHPPNLKLQLLNSIGNQRFNITHIR